VDSNARLPKADEPIPSERGKANGSAHTSGSEKRDLAKTAIEYGHALQDSTKAREDAQSESIDATIPESTAARPKLTMLGDFLLVRKLGEGGMGTVYQAQQIGLDREVAIKVLAKHLAEDPKFLERFQREARVMAQLDHPNILRCYTVGESHGFHFLSMELAAGGSLEAWIQQLGKLPVRDALHVIIAAASGLQHAHEQNLIHRDIKPGNILITAKGFVKVADLGLVKEATEDLTLTPSGTGVGTPIYSSLEQMRDAKHVDHRSDIYSLGCVLYRCLTGRPPFEGDNYIELFEAKDKGKYPPTRRFNDDVPRRLDLIIDRTLEKNPKDRHQSCAELIEDLQSLGLTGVTLSFVADATAMPLAAAATQRTSAKTPTVRQPTVAPAAKPAPAPEWWYVRAMNFDGVRRLSRHQLRDLIKDPNFDLKAEGSRSQNSGFQPLTSYREFEPILRSRASKMLLDQKATRYKNQYAAILKEEEEVQQENQSTIQVRRFWVWIAPLVGLLVLTGLAYLAWLAIKSAGGK
jgi:serine/threonine-protein kinase